MRIVHISSRDGKASYRVHSSLRSIGVDSMLYVAKRHREDPSIVSFAISPAWRSTLRRRWRQLRMSRDMNRYRQAKVLEAFVDDRTAHGGDLLPQLPWADIVHVHVEHHVADFEAFYPTIPLRVPVVRTLHDEHFITGGCTQDGGCQRYLTGCGLCPQLASDDENDLSWQVWLRKRRALDRVPVTRLSLVAPSRWLADLVRSAVRQSFPITVIPNAVDTSVFRPLDRLFARRVLGIPADSNVVAFVADPIHRPNKRFGTLLEALNNTAAEQGSAARLWLVSAGGGILPAPSPVPHRHLGRVTDDRLMALLYNSADVLVLPSLQENCPQVAIEALACGVPVVGSETGGVPEIVRPNRTGLLMAPGSASSLKEALYRLLADEEWRRRLGTQGRKVATQEYSLEIQARSYMRVYEDMLESLRGVRGSANRGFAESR